MSFDPNSASSDYIAFGSGGGFTGKSITYYLSNEGKLFMESDNGYVKLASIPNALTSQIYSNYTLLGLDNMILNDPGNKYSFIVRYNNSDSKTLKWGNRPLDNKNIQTFFNILMKLVKDNIKIDQTGDK
jgi:hypothetical protein